MSFFSPLSKGRKKLKAPVEPCRSSCARGPSPRRNNMSAVTMMRSRWSPADPIAMRLSYITANSRQTWRLPSSLISTMDLTVFFQKMYLMRWSMSKQHSPWCRLLWMEEWLQCSCLVKQALVAKQPQWISRESPKSWMSSHLVVICYSLYSLSCRW